MCFLCLLGIFQYENPDRHLYVNHWIGFLWVGAVWAAVFPMWRWEWEHRHQHVQARKKT